MHLSIVPWRSLKARVTLFTLSIFLIGIWSLAFYTSRMLREDMQRLLGDQQFSTASLMAAEINHELNARLWALETVAASISPAMLGNTAAAQELLGERPIFQGLFNDGVVVYRHDGTAIAEVPRSAGRVGENYADRDHLLAPLREGKSTIGKPHFSRNEKSPEFVMAVPVRDAQGKVIGALAGQVNLGKPNFLDKITEHSYGKSGGYMLVVPQHRLVVTATDKSRIMETLPVAGISPLLDRFIQGYEGSGVAVNPLGAEVLASAKGIPVAGWYVAALLPTAEAFAPIRDMQLRMLLATFFLTLLAGGLIWWMLRRQLAPMLATARTLATLSDTSHAPQPLPVSSQDEIGDLIGGFNRLLKTLGQREETLKETQSRTQLLLDSALDAVICIDQDGKVMAWNSHAEVLFGYSAEQVLGCEMAELIISPVYRQRHRHGMARYMEHGEGRVVGKRLELTGMRADGTEVPIEVTIGALREDGKYLFSAYVHDITERKQAEEDLKSSRNRYQGILHNMMEAYWRVDQDGRIVEANHAIGKMHGYSIDELLGMSVSDFEVIESREDTRRHIEAIRTKGYHFFESRHRCKDGRIIDLEISANIALDNPGNVDAFHRDITERKQAEAELQIAATAFESQEGIFVTDAAGVILKVNQAFTAITGYSAAEAVGQKASLTKSGRHDASFYAAMWKSIREAGEWQGEIWNRRKNGEVYPEWLAITAVKSSNGETSHYVSTLTDITLRKTAEDEIKNLAFYDPLTHLPNRRLLLDRLKQALASSTRSGREGALLFIDLDNFKTLNDTRGHHIGDLLLQQVAQRLVSCVREGDTVARLGGDEFVMMLEDLSNNSREAATQTEAVGKKILALLNVPYQLAGDEYHCTPSIGATVFADHQNSVEELLKAADLAMYQAKAEGRNTLRFFDPEMQAAVTARAALANDLRAGLAAKQFLLFYQGQVNRSGRWIGVESLVRWQHPQRGMVSPAEFIPLAEETGLILPLGHWVLETSCIQLALWAAQPRLAHLTIAVNVSAQQFSQVDFVDQVLEVLEDTGANPQRLKLELTESLLVSNVAEVIEKMTALKARGVAFSLDDFGTGYSSLAYLKRLPLDQLKIDQSFVRDVFTDSNDGAICQAIIALSQTMGLSVIAEGVETEEQHAFLARLGCQAYQGYFFCRPMPAKAFEAFAHASPRPGNGC